MNIEQTLLEYGQLRNQYDALTKRMKELFEQDTVYEDNGFLIKELPQLAQYFDYYKEFIKTERHFNGNYWEEPSDIEDWAYWKREKVKPITYELIKLIEERKVIRVKMGYKKASITKYAKKIAKEDKQ